MGAFDDLTPAGQTGAFGDLVEKRKKELAVNPTFGDYLRSLASGAANVVTTAGQATRTLGEVTNLPDIENVGNWLRKDIGQPAEEYWQEGMTPAGKEAASGEFLSERPLSTFGLSAAQSAPGMVAMGATGMPIAAGITKAAAAGGGIAKMLTGLGVGEKASKFLAKTAPSAIGMGASEGVFSGIQNAAQTGAEIERLSEAQLLAQPAFQRHLAATDPGLPQEQRIALARNALSHEAEQRVMAMTAPVTGAIGVATGGGILGQMMRKAKGGVIRSAVRGGVRETEQEFPQSGAEALIQNIVAKDLYDKDREIAKDVLTQAIIGAGAGGLMGAVGGGGHGLLSKRTEPPAPGLAPPVPASPTAGEGPPSLSPGPVPGPGAGGSITPTGNPSTGAEIVAKTTIERDGVTSTKITRRDGSIEIDGVQVVAPRPVETPVAAEHPAGPEGELAALRGVLTRRGDISDEDVQWLKDHKYAVDTPLGGFMPTPSARRRFVELTKPAQAPDTPVITPVDEAAHGAAPSPQNELPEPTPDQAKAGNYQLGHANVGGLDISIESPEGSVRSDKENVPPKWSSTITGAHYGYVKGVPARSPDKEHVDVFVKTGTPEDWAGDVFVIDQNKADGSFDESKTMIGAASLEEARSLYLANYTPGWESRIRQVTPMTMEAYKARLQDPQAFLQPQPTGETNAPQVEGPGAVDVGETPGNGPAVGEGNAKPEGPAGEGGIVGGPREPPRTGPTAPETPEGPGIGEPGPEIEKPAPTPEPPAAPPVAPPVEKPVEPPAEKPKKPPKEPKPEPEGPAKLKMTEARRYWKSTVVPNLDADEAKAFEAPEWRVSDGAPHIVGTDGNVYHFVRNEGVISHVEGFSSPKAKKTITGKGEAEDVIGKMLAAPDSAGLTALLYEGTEVDGEAGKIPFVPKPENHAQILGDNLVKLLVPNSIVKAVEANLKKSGFRITDRSMEEADAENTVLASIYKPEQARVEDTGEQMAGARKQIDDVTIDKDEPDDAERAVDEIISAIQPSKLLTPERPEQSFGSLMFLEAIFDGVEGPTTALGAKFGGVRNNRPWQTGMREALIAAAKADIGKLKDAAKAYADTILMLQDATIDIKTVDEAATALDERFLKDGDYNTEDGAKLKPFMAKDLNDLIIKYGELFGGERENSTDQTDRVKKKPLIPPRLEDIVRAGMKDHREGKMVDQDAFMESFGFRGVEFGNWVNNVERQENLNLAYDGLMDMADILGVGSKIIGLQGKLGLAFGARGRGKAMAHFEPDNNVINLTKNKGNGTVSHEWKHALDHNVGTNGETLINQMKGSLKNRLNVDQMEAQVRAILKGESVSKERNEPPREAAIRWLLTAQWSYPMTNLTSFFNAAKRMDEGRPKPYWSTPHELLARAFESFMYDATKGGTPYLVSQFAAPGFATEKNGFAGTPYPGKGERAYVSEMFKHMLSRLDIETLDAKVMERKYRVVEIPGGKFAIFDQNNVPYRASQSNDAPTVWAQKESAERALKQLAGESYVFGTKDLQLSQAYTSAFEIIERIDAIIDELGLVPYPEVKDGHLTESMWKSLKYGWWPANAAELKLFAAQAHRIEPANLDNIKLRHAEDDFEAALTRFVGQKIHDWEAEGHDRKSIYEKIVELYKRQPTLDVRTSTSAGQQQYSTPMPHAYIAGLLGRVTASTKVYDPTAGDGLLLLTANPRNAIGVELDPRRANNLKLIEMQSRPGDATKAVPDLVKMEEPDVVLANPPFGAIPNMQIEGYTIGKLEHQIAMNALKALPERGRAVLILGANLQPGIISGKERIFLNWLYSHYNVADHFEIDGKLYGRQGTTFPVRMLVIAGRQTSSKIGPASGTIDRVLSFDELWSRYEKAYDSSETILVGSIGKPPGLGSTSDTGEGVSGGPGGQDSGGVPEGETGTGPEAGGGPAPGPGPVGGGGGAGPSGPDHGPRTGPRDGGGGGRGPRGGPGGRIGGGPGTGGNRPVGDPGGNTGVDGLTDEELDAIIERAFGEKPETQGRPRNGNGTAGPAPNTGEGKRRGGKRPASDTKVDDALAGLEDLFKDLKFSAKQEKSLEIDGAKYKELSTRFDVVWDKLRRTIPELGAQVNKFMDWVAASLRHIAGIVAYARAYVKEMIATNNLMPPQRSSMRVNAVDNEIQVVYSSRSKGDTEGILIPISMLDGLNSAMDTLEDHIAGEGIDSIDHFVAKEMGYESIAAMHRVMGGYQIDALALAIRQMQQSGGFIVGDDCVAADTLIYDPIAGTHTRIDELAGRGEPITVLALTPDGLTPAMASAPFKKGVADLYRVVLDDGREITVTSQHRFLTPTGWSTIASGLREGHFLASVEDRPSNNSEFCQSVHGEDGPHSTETPEDCLVRYSSAPCHRGAQPLPETGSGLELLPLQDDAHAHTHPWSQTDDLDVSITRSHHHRFASLRARSDSSPLENRAPSWTEDQACAYAWLLSALKRPVAPPSPRSTALPHRQCASVPSRQHESSESDSLPLLCEVESLPGEDIDERDERSRRDAARVTEQILRPYMRSKSEGQSHELEGQSLFPYADHTGWRSVVSITFVEHAEFFDMWVPGFANYVAEGLINHNTGVGKGRVAAAMIHWATKQKVEIVANREQTITNALSDEEKDGNNVSTILSNYDEWVRHGKPHDIAPKAWAQYQVVARALELSVKEEAPMIPIFLSFKPTLYSDMYRDLTDIGKGDVRIMMSNAKVEIKDLNTTDSTVLFKNDKGQATRETNYVIEHGELPEGKDALFTTYDQLKQGGARVRMLLRLAATGRAMLIMDEAHNAAGLESGIGELFQELINTHKVPTVYLSATFAKRPDNMPVYAKTDLGLIADDPQELVAATTSGGIQMQQVMSSMLVRSGQMIRRERSYDGVDFQIQEDTAGLARDGRRLDEATQRLRAIRRADDEFHDWVQRMGATLWPMLEAANLIPPGSRPHDTKRQSGFDHHDFASVVHNYVKQLLLAIKVPAAVAEAIDALKSGQKPLFTTENTMTAALKHYVDTNNLSIGDELTEFGWKGLLQRALDKSHVISYEPPTGPRLRQRGGQAPKIRVTVPLYMLPLDIQKAYMEAQSEIESYSSDLPASPLDSLKHAFAEYSVFRKLKEGGGLEFSIAKNDAIPAGARMVRPVVVKEITGRSMRVDLSGDVPKLASVEEKGHHTDLTKGFNNGDIDILLLNSSGSTGISLHAGEKFSDQRPRRMIVLQAAADISVFKQMLGRIHRTGQVEWPIFRVLTTALPAERRPMAILKKKFASMTSNTSASQKSSTDVNVVDFINYYGDQVVTTYLRGKRDLARSLKIDLNPDVKIPTPDAAIKSTGRAALMTVDDQTVFFDDIEHEYNTLIAELDATGRNTLNVRVLNLQAIPLVETTLIEGEDNSRPFTSDAFLQQLSGLIQGTTPTPEFVKAEVERQLGGKTMREIIDKIQDDMTVHYDEAQNQKTLRIAEIDKELAVPDLSSAKTNDLHTRRRALADDLSHFAERKALTTAWMSRHPIGSGGAVTMGDEEMHGVIIGYKIRETHAKAGNPYSPSNFEVKIATNTPSGVVPVTISTIENDPAILSRFWSKDVNTDEIDEKFKVGAQVGLRRDMYVVTGNIPAAFVELQKANVTGNVISFNYQNGETQDYALLLPGKYRPGAVKDRPVRVRNFKAAAGYLAALTVYDETDPEKLAAAAAYTGGLSISKPNDKAQDAGRVGVATADGSIRIATRDGNIYFIAEAKLGLKWWDNKELKRILGDFSKPNRGSTIYRVVTDDMGRAMRALDFIMRKGAVYVTHQYRDLLMPFIEAQRAESNEPKASSKAIASSTMTKAGAKLVELSAAVSKERGVPVSIVATAIPEQHQAAKRLYEALFGVPVVGFHSNTPAFDVNGISWRGVTYWSDTAENPFLTTIGHELGHHIKRTMPDVWAQLVTELTPLLRTDVTYSQKGMTDAAALHEELISNIIGDRFVERKFWSGLLNKDQSTLGRLLDSVLDWIDGIIRRMVGLKSLRSDLFLTDMNAARSAVARAIYEVSQRSGTPIGEPGSPAYAASMGFSSKLELTPRIAGSATLGNFADATFGNVATYLKDAVTTGKQFNWLHRTIGTQQHKALINRAFGRVYESVQSFLNDTARYANSSADLAPDLLPRLDKPSDLWKNWTKVKKADIVKLHRALYAGTLYGGGNPLEGKVWDRETLLSGEYTPTRTKDRTHKGVGEPIPIKVFDPLTPFQADLYEQALAAVNHSLEEQGKSLIHRVARGYGIGFDRDMSLEDVAQVVRDKFDDLLADLKTKMAYFQDEDRINDTADELRGTFGDEAAEEFINEQKKQADDIAKSIAAAMKGKDQVGYVEDKITALQEHGYFPAMRFGQYALQVLDKDKKQTHFALYENAGDRNRAARQMREDYPDADVHVFVISKEKYKLFQSLNLDTLELFIDFATDPMGNPLKSDPLAQQFIQAAVADRSYLKRHLHRKGVPGYSDDITRILASFITANSRNVAGNYHGAEMRMLANAIPDGDVADEATDLVNYVSDPMEEAAGLRGFLFAQYLGGSLAFGLINMTQPALITAPYFAQFTGYLHGVERLADAARMDPEKLTGNLKDAFERAKQEGVVAPQELHQLRAQTGGLPIAKSMALRKLQFAWGAIYSLTEQWNRKTTFIAAYKIAEEKGNPDPYEFAKQAVEETQFVYNRGSRPNWARGPVGSVIMTFRQFSIAYLELMTRLWKQDDKRPFWYMIATLFAGAGAEGFPFAEDIEDILDTIMQWSGFAWNTKKKMREMSEAVLGEDFAPFLLHGVSAFLPVDIAGRLGFANLIPGTSALKPGEKMQAREVLEIAGPIGQFVPAEGTAMGRFLDRLAHNDYWGMAKSGVLTRAVADLAKGAEVYETGEYRDMKGKKIMEAGPTEAAFQMVGLRPARFAKEGRIIGEVQEDINLQRQVESEIAEQWAKAIVRGSDTDIEDAINRLESWNTTNPETPISINRPQLMQRVLQLRRGRAERQIKGAPPEIRGSVAERINR